MNECLWVRGAHPAAITPGGVVVTAPGNLEIAQQFWRLLHEGADLSSVLQQLTAAYAADLASLPEFVAAIPDGDTLHVAIRGGYELVVRTREGTQSVTSGGVIMWMEHRFSNVVGWRISAVVFFETYWTPNRSCGVWLTQWFPFPFWSQVTTTRTTSPKQRNRYPNRRRRRPNPRCRRSPAPPSVRRASMAW